MKSLAITLALVIGIAVISAYLVIAWLNRHREERERFKAKLERVELARKRWQARQASRWSKWRLRRAKSHRDDRDIET